MRNKVEDGVWLPFNDAANVMDVTERELDALVAMGAFAGRDDCGRGHEVMVSLDGVFSADEGLIAGMARRELERPTAHSGRALAIGKRDGEKGCLWEETATAVVDEPSTAENESREPDESGDHLPDDESPLAVQVVASIDRFKPNPRNPRNPRKSRNPSRSSTVDESAADHIDNGLTSSSDNWMWSPEKMNDDDIDSSVSEVAVLLDDSFGPRPKVNLATIRPRIRTICNTTGQRAIRLLDAMDLADPWREFTNRIAFHIDRTRQSARFGLALFGVYAIAIIFCASVIWMISAAFSHQTPAQAHASNKVLPAASTSETPIRKETPSKKVEPVAGSIRQRLTEAEQKVIEQSGRISELNNVLTKTRIQLELARDESSHVTKKTDKLKEMRDSLASELYNARKELDIMRHVEMFRQDELTQIADVLKNAVQPANKPVAPSYSVPEGFLSD